MSSAIHYLHHKEIDKDKWDQCIENAGNGLVYAYSYYMDHMAKHWDALVMDDYELVMPLTWNSKYGIAYLYQPFLTAQLGVFGNGINEKKLEAFLDAIPTKFRYWDIYLNHANAYNGIKYNLYPRSNYILSLKPPSDQLYKNYRENVQRNIKKSQQAGARIEKNFDVEKVIGLALKQMLFSSKEAKDNVNRFRELYKYLCSRNMALTYGVVTTHGALVASCVFFKSHGRAYYILVGNHPDGKTLGASHALIDAFIRDHAGQDLLLDFEGSDIPSLAFFYSSFGATEQKYAGLRENKLPFYLRWMKAT
jgi:hypothetical protein